MKRLRKTVSILVLAVSLLVTQGFLISAPAPASAATAPQYTITRYVTKPNNAYSWGVAAGQAATSNGPNSGVIILDFGKPQTWTQNGQTVYGSLLLDNSTKVTTDQIATYVENFLQGFWNNTPVNGPFVKLVIGTNNIGSSTNNTHGQAWANLVNNVNSWISSNGYGVQEEAIGGSDIEIAWNTASSSRNWVDGYNSTAQHALYDYGDDAGGTNPNQNGWTANDVWYVAYGATWDWPVPEIYYTVDATLDWQPLSLWAYNNKGNRINFMGTLTEYAADSTTLTPAQGWSALYNALNSDSRTAQSSLSYSTDITWSN